MGVVAAIVLGPTGLRQTPEKHSKQTVAKKTTTLLPTVLQCYTRFLKQTISTSLSVRAFGHTVWSQQQRVRATSA